MSEDIKEIMITQQDLIDWIDRPPSNEDIDLINYIVNRLENFYNLQEENERLKEIENFKFSIRKDETKTPPIVTKSYKSEYEDYKSRCEKAITRIKLLGKYNGEYCTRNFKMMSADFNDLLNILQGSDKE